MRGCPSRPAASKRFMDVARPSLVFVTRRAPFPLDNGGRIRSHRLVMGLASRFRVTLVTYEHHRRSPDGHTSRAALERLLPGVEVRTVPGLGPDKRLRQARSLFSRRSWAFGQYGLARFGAAVADAIRDQEAAITHFADPGVAQFGPLPGTVNVYAPDNIEHRIQQQGGAGGNAVRHLFSAVEWRKVLAEEQRLWRTMDLSLAVSEVDAEAMRAGGARRVMVVPNGADPVEPFPLPRRAPGDPLRLVFVGSGGYRPYELGLAWLVSDVLPLVRAKVPVTLEVVGRRPQRPVAGEGVRYVGVVPSVAPWYEGAHAAVVPVHAGSGTRLKMVEALAYGRPVISTGLGAEGLPVEAGTHYLRGDDAGDFASALLDVAARCERPEARLAGMLAAGRSAVSALLWPRIVEDLARAYLVEADRLTGGRLGSP